MTPRPGRQWRQCAASRSSSSRSTNERRQQLFSDTAAVDVVTRFSNHTCRFAPDGKQIEKEEQVRRDWVEDLNSDASTTCCVLAALQTAGCCVSNLRPSLLRLSLTHEADNVQTLSATSHLTTRSFGSTCSRRRRVPRRVRLAVLGPLRPGAAMCAARRRRLGAGKHHHHTGCCRQVDDDAWPSTSRWGRRTVGPLLRLQLHSLHVVLGQWLQTRKMLSKYIFILFPSPMFTTCAEVVVFSVMSVCRCVCQHDSWTVWDIIMKSLWEQDVAKSSEEFENGCIPIHCGTRAVI